MNHISCYWDTIPNSHEEKINLDDLLYGQQAPGYGYHTKKAWWNKATYFMAAKK